MEEKFEVSINKKNSDYLTSDLNNPKRESLRSGFGQGLLKVGQINPNVFALCADLTESTQMHLFKESFPERFVEIGIAEQNLVTVASGIAAMGKIPFVSSYAAFSPGRNWEQIRTTICLNDRPVKIVGSHSGISVGPDGATHQMLEDIALMRVLPNMVVIAPGDSVEALKATLMMSLDSRPNYIRLAREATPVIFEEEMPFKIGQAYTLLEGQDISLITTGTMTYHALRAAQELFKKGIDAEVVHVPTIKPLDEETILKSLKKTKIAITVEEGQMNAGFGSSICELASEKYPVPILRLGIKDRFGESGQPDQLLERFGLTYTNIIKQTISFINLTKKA